MFPHLVQCLAFAAIAECIVLRGLWSPVKLLLGAAITYSLLHYFDGNKNSIVPLLIQADPVRHHSERELLQ